MTMPASERKRRPDEHLTDAELNELVDGTLAASATARAKAHLTDCAECDERYRTLLATVSALQTAPSLMPRRSFRLTPAQAKSPEKSPGRFDRFAEWIVPGMPAIRAATVAVALLLLSVAAIDLITHRGTGDESAGPVLMQQAPNTQEPSTAFRAQEAAPATEPMLQAAEESSTGAVAESTADEMGNASDEAAPAPESAGAGMAQSTQEAVLAVAPAEVAPVSQPTTGALGAAPAPAVEATPLASPVATAEATSAAAEKANRGGAELSRWRIAEFGLLLLLLWLVVTWVGRARFGDQANSDSADSN